MLEIDNTSKECYYYCKCKLVPPGLAYAIM